MSLIDSEMNDKKEINELNKEYEELMRIFILNNTVIKKELIFKKFLSQSNVHIVIHYSDVIAEYKTAFNCLIFSEKNKHRDFKKKILSINHYKMIKTLLLKESVQ